jgi:hypothetical protein
MKDKSKIFIVIIVVAVAVSGYIGGKAIVGAAASLRSTGSEPGAPGELEAAGSEATELLADMNGPGNDQKAPDITRDPFAPYTGAPPADGQPAARPAPPRPSVPAYTVTAVFLDDDPTAILTAGGDRTIVHVGDEVSGGRVTAISANGVTVEGASGTQTYPYSQTR